MRRAIIASGLLAAVAIAASCSAYPSPPLPKEDAGSLQVAAAPETAGLVVQVPLTLPASVPAPEEVVVKLAHGTLLPDGQTRRLTVRPGGSATGAVVFNVKPAEGYVVTVTYMAGGLAIATTTLPAIALAPGDVTLLALQAGMDPSGGVSLSFGPMNSAPSPGGGAPRPAAPTQTPGTATIDMTFE